MPSEVESHWTTQAQPLAAVAAAAETGWSCDWTGATLTGEETRLAALVFAGRTGSEIGKQDHGGRKMQIR